MNFLAGTYYINWQTLNDLIPPYYTPVKRTTVIITNNRSNEII